MKTPIVTDEMIRMEFWIDVQGLNAKQARDILQHEKKPTIAESMYILHFRVRELGDILLKAIKEFRKK